MPSTESWSLVVIDEGKCENSLSLSLSSTFASLLSRSVLLLAKFLPQKKNSRSKNEVTLEGFQFSIAKPDSSSFLTDQNRNQQF